MEDFSRYSLGIDIRVYNDGDLEVVLKYDGDEIDTAYVDMEHVLRLARNEE